jgi:hypothetical protein
LAVAAGQYHTALTEVWDSGNVGPYLAGRGITEDVAVDYGLGVVDGSLPEHEAYKGMLCIPYLTPLGGVVSLKFRRAHDCTSECEHAKYISPYPTRLFNTSALDRADDLGYVFLTEGEIDAILLDSCGFPAIGVPGVECWQQHDEWRSLLAGYPRVFVPFDRDEAGRRFSEQVRRSLKPGVAVLAGLPGEAEGARDVGDGFRVVGRAAFTDYYAGIVRQG